MEKKMWAVAKKDGDLNPKCHNRNGSNTNMIQPLKPASGWWVSSLLTANRGFMHFHSMIIFFGNKQVDGCSDGSHVTLLPGVHTLVYSPPLEVD